MNIHKNIHFFSELFFKFVRIREIKREIWRFFKNNLKNSQLMPIFFGFFTKNRDFWRNFLKPIAISVNL